MNTTLKNKWIRALRSGRYKQTEGVLEKEKGFNCCLGVLCRVDRVRPGIGSDGIYFDTDKERLSSKLLRQFDLPENVADDLADMNDKGSSFKKIANWIKENL